MKTIKQISFDEAIENIKMGRNVYIIKPMKTGASLKNFSKITIDDALTNAEDYIFIIIEE